MTRGGVSGALSRYPDAGESGPTTLPEQPSTVIRTLPSLPCLPARWRKHHRIDRRSSSLGADMTLNRSNAVKSWTEETGREGGERFRIAGRLELPFCLRGVMRAKQVELGQHTQQVLGGLFGAGHQSDLVSHRQLDEP